MFLRRKRKRVAGADYDYWALCESVRTAAGPRQRVVADVTNLRVERVRDFGQAWLGLSLWRRLGLHKLLDELIPRGRELDVLGTHKQKLCAHLMDRYRDWFGIRFEFLLYDVTSTFFEGQANENTKAARGYSRDNRSDCKQVCIGLVCTPEGLPLSFEVFAGNRADVTTVEEIITRMEEIYGQAQRVWVMDRGMVSEKNIAFLRHRNARCLVGTPKSQLRNFEQPLLDKEGWHQVQDGLEAKLLAHPDGKGEEQFVLCRSTARAAKERAMLQRQADLLCEELQRIDLTLRRRPEADVEKVGRRIGRWLGKYASAAKVVEVEVIRSSVCARRLRLLFHRDFHLIAGAARVAAHDLIGAALEGPEQGRCGTRCA